MSRRIVASCSQCRRVGLSCPTRRPAGTSKGHSLDRDRNRIQKVIISTRQTGNQEVKFLFYFLSRLTCDELGPKVTFVIPSSGGDLSLYSVLDSDMFAILCKFRKKCEFCNYHISVALTLYDYTASDPKVYFNHKQNHNERLSVFCGGTRMLRGEC